MDIILPAGSTSADLQTAIDSAALGDRIIILGDMVFLDAVQIIAEKTITIQSDTGNSWVMSAPTTRPSLIPHIDSSGNLTIHDITFDGLNIAGGIFVRDGSLAMKNTVIKNCASIWGGAVHLAKKTTATISDSTIKDNVVTAYGGGAYANKESILIMSNVILSGNKADGIGTGGGAVQSEGTLIMSDVVISGNTAGSSGGGIASSGALEIKGKSYIVNNKALMGHGGGISGSYKTMIIGDETVFSCNHAGAFYAPPDDAKTLYPNIGFASTSILEHPLNDYDISYTTSEPLGKGFYVSYNANGGTGSYEGADTIPGETNTVLGSADTGISRVGYILAGWNTVADGTGDSYAVGSTIVVNCLETLYAQWIPEREYAIVYNANGGSGDYTDANKQYGADYIVLDGHQTGIVRIGFMVENWNTQPNGSGVSYAPGEKIKIADDVTLYAQWAEMPKYTVTYDSNGGKGGYEDPGREFDLNYMVLSSLQTKVSRTGCLFSGWNTKPNGSGTAYAPGDIIVIEGEIKLYAQWDSFPMQLRLCSAPTVKSRRAIEGQILWVDDDNAGDTRPPSVEVLLLRDGEVYRRTTVDTTGDGYFGFCCIPAQGSSERQYSYRVDETSIAGYAKTIDGYNIINTLEP